MEDKKNVPDSDLDKISGGTPAPDKQAGSWQQAGGSGSEPQPDDLTDGVEGK